MEIAIIILAVIAVIGGLIFAYGSGKEKIGAMGEKILERKGQREREVRAKKIESEAPPTSTNRIVDAFNRLRGVRPGKNG